MFRNRCQLRVPIPRDGDLRLCNWKPQDFHDLLFGGIFESSDHLIKYVKPFIGIVTVISPSPTLSLSLSLSDIDKTFDDNVTHRT